MNAVHMAQKAYGATAAPVRTNRSMEYAAFARVTRDLASASKGKGQSFAALAKALHENRRLWIVLATDVVNPENSLPSALRARILYLSEFVEVQSRKVLKGEATTEVLVEVNSSVMGGLAQEGNTP